MMTVRMVKYAPKYKLDIEAKGSTGIIMSEGPRFSELYFKTLLAALHPISHHPLIHAYMYILVAPTPIETTNNTKTPHTQQ